MNHRGRKHTDTMWPAEGSVTSFIQPLLWDQPGLKSLIKCHLLLLLLFIIMLNLVFQK